MRQRWVQNFPEGPCSPCCSQSDCQSLTSAVCCRLVWEPHGGAWLGGWRCVCHTGSPCSPLSALIHCCNAGRAAAAIYQENTHILLWKLPVWINTGRRCSDKHVRWFYSFPPPAVTAKGDHFDHILSPCRVKQEPDGDLTNERLTGMQKGPCKHHETKKRLENVIGVMVNCRSWEYSLCSPI